ncbi:MAG: hypothetical protein Q9221_003871 [Calogaya cf. arnoldii]
MAATDFNIPGSTSTVSISIINTTSRIRGIPTSTFMEPPIKGHDTLDCPAYSFLIEHKPLNQKLLFDLGVRKDWENLAPKISTTIKEKGWSVTVEKGVNEILKDNGVEPGSINAIIWRSDRLLRFHPWGGNLMYDNADDFSGSHYHWDHSGDPSTFPHSTDLVVGPGFKDDFVPAYPSKPNCPIHESDYANRELREISFDSDVEIGGYKAFDYFGDGSFYLLDSPGHAIGHMCGLAR